MLKNYLPSRVNLSASGLLIKSLFYWVQNYSIPLIVVILAMVGTGYLILKKGVIFFWLLAYFVMFIFVYIYVHKLGLYAGDSQRFNIILSFPVIVLASVGLNGIYRSTGKYARVKWLALVMLSFLISLNYLKCFPYVYAEISNSALQAQHKSVVKLNESIDSSCVFVTCEPALFITTINRSSVNIGYIFNNEIFNKYLKNRDLILFKDTQYKANKDRF
jgi:hypothetical protein